MGTCCHCVGMMGCFRFVASSAAVSACTAPRTVSQRDASTRAHTVLRFRRYGCFHRSSNECSKCAISLRDPCLQPRFTTFHAIHRWRLVCLLRFARFPSCSRVVTAQRLEMRRSLTPQVCVGWCATGVRCAVLQLSLYVQTPLPNEVLPV
jgi:hypothetical protein